MYIRISLSLYIYIYNTHIRNDMHIHISMYVYMYTSVYMYIDLYTYIYTTLRTCAGRRPAPPSPHLRVGLTSRVKIHQRGVQWKQGTPKISEKI